MERLGRVGRSLVAPVEQIDGPFVVVEGTRDELARLAWSGDMEMLDHCAARGIVSDVEVIPIQQINEAYERVLRSDVRYRFVIDIASIRA